MKNTLTKEQVKAGIEIIKAVADAIRAVKEVPSGELYARTMSHLSLQDYESIIGTLKRAGLVQEENNLLKWIEPK